MVIEVMGSVDPATTVRIAVPAATVLSAFVAIAVIVVEPWFAPSATPVWLTEATDESLEYQAAMPFRFTVVPAVVVPMAINCVL